jgi:hypothetical protein
LLEKRSEECSEAILSKENGLGRISVSASWMAGQTKPNQPKFTGEDAECGRGLRRGAGLFRIIIAVCLG